MLTRITNRISFGSIIVFIIIFLFLVIFQMYINIDTSLFFKHILNIENYKYYPYLEYIPIFEFFISLAIFLSSMFISDFLFSLSIMLIKTFITKKTNEIKKLKISTETESMLKTQRFKIEYVKSNIRTQVYIVSSLIGFYIILFICKIIFINNSFNVYLYILPILIIIIHIYTLYYITRNYFSAIYIEHLKGNDINAYHELQSILKEEYYLKAKIEKDNL